MVFKHFHEDLLEQRPLFMQRLNKYFLQGLPKDL